MVEKSLSDLSEGFVCTCGGTCTGLTELAVETNCQVLEKILALI